MSSTFSSTKFFLSELAKEQKPKTTRMRRIELDIVEDPTIREVCQGKNCALYYDRNDNNYITAGNCTRGSLCTETRLLKDGLFLKTGNVSNTNKCVNYGSQLKNWN